MFLHVILAMSWRFALGVARLSPIDSWDRQQLGPQLMDGWGKSILHLF